MWGSIASGSRPVESIMLSAALLEKRSGPSWSTTMTASVRPSKIACSLLRSAVRTPKLSFSEVRIDSSERASCADLVAATGLQRHLEGPGRHLAGGSREAGDPVGDPDRDQEAGEDPEDERDQDRLRAITER